MVEIDKYSAYEDDFRVSSNVGKKNGKKKDKKKGQPTVYSSKHIRQALVKSEAGKSKRS